MEREHRGSDMLVRIVDSESVVTVLEGYDGLRPKVTAKDCGQLDAIHGSRAMGIIGSLLSRKAFELVMVIVLMLKEELHLLGGHHFTLGVIEDPFQEGKTVCAAVNGIDKSQCGAVCSEGGSDDEVKTEQEKDRCCQS